jgi:hypothetical protein
MDPKEFVKEALEAIVRNKLFALTAIQRTLGTLIHTVHST